MGEFMDDPLAFFLTWVTYGTWLPGDERGWIKRQRGWQSPDPMREYEAQISMTEDACLLSQRQRDAVEGQIRETCAHRGWLLHAVSCRSNHVHVVVHASDTNPDKIRADLKAWTARRLQQFDMDRTNWWAERGSIRYLYNQDGFEAAVAYVLRTRSK